MIPLELLCFYFSMYIGADLPPIVFDIMMGFLGVYCLLLVYIASFFFLTHLGRIYSINLIFHFLEQNGIFGEAFVTGIHKHNDGFPVTPRREQRKWRQVGMKQS